MEQRKKKGKGFAAITLCCLMALAGFMGAGTKEVQAAEGEGYSFNDGVLTVTGIASNDLSTVNVTESLVIVRQILCVYFLQIICTYNS